MELPNDLKDYERPGFALFTDGEAALGIWIVLAIALLLDALGVWK